MAEFDPLVVVLGLGILGLIPFLVIMTTSFVKIVVVLTLVRNALGVQQVPPTMALSGLAIILTLYIMAPIGIQAYERLENEDLANMETAAIGEVLTEAAAPFRSFLQKHASDSETAFFYNTARKLWPEDYARGVTKSDFLVLIPSFTVSELTTAFQIGFLLYLPFIAIDLIISNILLAMGMMMVSPMTISLPFKLLLFVLLDGWTRLIHGLVLTYG